MRLEWSRQPFVGPDRCVYCGRAANGHACSHCRHEHVFGRPTVGPRIGPRTRLPQAKDVPEQVILDVLSREPGKWYTHWSLESDSSLPHVAPELVLFPTKVLFAKLCAMARRGLIRGSGRNSHSRGDWHVPVHLLV